DLDVEVGIAEADLVPGGGSEEVRVLRAGNLGHGGYFPPFGAAPFDGGLLGGGLFGAALFDAGALFGGGGSGVWGLAGGAVGGAALTAPLKPSSFASCIALRKEGRYAALGPVHPSTSALKPNTRCLPPKGTSATSFSSPGSNRMAVEAEMSRRI